jgi:peptidoglycan hydrolase-like protein with peptidoglycan-binding domain
MTEHSNNLSLNQQGKDVALLQSRLSSIGYAIDMSEIIGELFGPSTYQAMLHIQQREGLLPTGVLDDVTARTLINRFESDETMLISRSVSNANLGIAFSTALLSSSRLRNLMRQAKAGQNGCMQLLTPRTDLTTIGDLPLYARLILVKTNFKLAIFVYVSWRFSLFSFSPTCLSKGGAHGE